MKKTIFIALNFCVLGLPLLQADGKQEAAKPSLFALEKKDPNHFYFGPEFLCYQLDMNIDGIDVSGTRFASGSKLGYEYLKPSAFYAGVDIFTARIGIDLKAFENGHYVSWQKGERLFGNLEARFGYTFAPYNALITAFMGTGIYSVSPLDHYNDSGFSEALPYLNTGVYSRYALSQFFSLGYKFSLLHTFGAHQKFEGTEGKRTSHHNSWGGMVGLPFTLQMGNWDVQFEPYFLTLDFSGSQNICGTSILAGYRF